VKHQVFSVAACPVERADVVVLLRADSGEPVYFCAACGCAWDEIPEAVDSVQSLAELAPSGVRLPTARDLEAHGVGTLGNIEVDERDFRVRVHPARGDGVWKNWREDLVRDGALRDIRIPGSTTADDWARLVAALSESRFTIATTGLAGGEALEEMLKFLPVLATESMKCIHITSGRLMFNLHMWGPEVIDFDLDPRQVTSERDADTILNFMQWVSDVLRRDVLLVDEGPSLSDPYVRWSHLRAQFEFRTS
jgi:hypothetical protein